MPLWPNKRETLARLLNRLGVVPLLERLGRRPGLVIVCYHRIGHAASEPFYAPLVSASPETFRQQLLNLRKSFEILSLEQALDALAHGGPRTPSALVTFDDGYRDNLDLAAPILQELNIPATLFVTSGFLDGQLPWWDHVAAVVRRSPLDRLRLDHPEPLDVPLPPGRRDSAVASVIAAYLRAPRPHDPSLLDHLQARASFALDPEAAARSLFLSWDDLPLCLSSGFSLGAHTHTHRRLSTLSPSEQSAELTEPKHRLESRLNRPIDTLAYPFGDPSAFDAQTRQLALSAGYRAAFALRPGLAGRAPLDLLDLPRFNVMPADSPPLLRARLALASSLGRSIL